MAITFGVGPTTGINTASGGSSGNSTLSMTLPTSWAANQFALMVIYLDQGTATTPTNWTPAAGNPYGAGTDKIYLFWKFLITGESNPSSTIAGSGTSISNVGNIWTYNNVDLELPVEVIGAASNGTGAAPSAGAINTLTNNALAVCIIGRGDNDNTYTTQQFGGSATGVTARAIAGTSAGNDTESTIFEKVITSPGTTGNGTATVAATDPFTTILIALRETQTQVVYRLAPCIAF